MLLKFEVLKTNLFEVWCLKQNVRVCAVGEASEGPVGGGSGSQAGPAESDTMCEATDLQTRARSAASRPGNCHVDAKPQKAAPPRSRDFVSIVVTLKLLEPLEDVLKFVRDS